MLNREQPQPGPWICGPAFLLETKGRVRLRNHSFLLDVMEGLAGTSAALTFLLFTFACPSKYATAASSPPLVPWSWVGKALVITAFLLLMRRFVDDRIVVDVASARLEFERRFLWISWRTPLDSTDNLLAVAVNARRLAASNRPVTWKYGLSLLHRDGRLIEALSPAVEDRAAVVSDGNTLAAKLQLKFYAGEPERFPSVESFQLLGVESSVSYGTVDPRGMSCLEFMMGAMLALAGLFAFGWVALQFVRML